MSEQEKRIQEIKTRADAVSEFGSLYLSSDGNHEYYYIDRDSEDYANPMIATDSVDAARFIFGAFSDIPWLLEQLESAIRAQQERENPQPLTKERLASMCGKAIWIDVEKAIPARYGYLSSGWFLITPDPIPGQTFAMNAKKETIYVTREDIWNRIKCYAHEPKGEHRA